MWAPPVVQPVPVVAAVPLAQVQVQAVMEAAILAELNQFVLRLLLATHAPQSVCEKWAAFPNTVKSGERERERVSDMDNVGNKEDDRQEGGRHSL